MPSAPAAITFLTLDCTTGSEAVLGGGSHRKKEGSVSDPQLCPGPCPTPQSSALCDGKAPETSSWNPAGAEPGGVTALQGFGFF